MAVPHLWVNVNAETPHAEHGPEPHVSAPPAQELPPEHWTATAPAPPVTWMPEQELVPEQRTVQSACGGQVTFAPKQELLPLH
jgi:hypothetical protein